MTLSLSSVTDARADHPASIRSALLPSIAAATIWLLSGQEAHASVIVYSNLESDGSYASSNGLIVGKSSFELSQAAEFVNSTGANVAVTQIDLGLSNSLGTNGATVSVWSANGHLPGSQLASWNISDQPGSAAEALTSISDISGLTLQAGASYFLQVSPGAGDTLDIWGFNNIGATTWLVAMSPPGSTTSTLGTAPAFEIQGTVPPVPLPAGLGLILSGLATLAVIRRTQIRSWTNDAEHGV